MPNHDLMVKVSNLRKSFTGVDALNGVSFSVGKGKVVVILGPSGSGKSTLCAASTSSRRRTAVRSGLMAKRSPLRKNNLTASAQRWAWCFNTSTFIHT